VEGEEAGWLSQSCGGCRGEGEEHVWVSKTCGLQIAENGIFGGRVKRRVSRCRAVGVVFYIDFRII
jgi:hypothetical protein